MNTLPQANTSAMTFIERRSDATAPDVRVAPASHARAGLSAMSIISDSKIFRTCFARCLGMAMQDFDVQAYGGMAEWRSGHQKEQSGIVLLCVTGETVTQATIEANLAAILEIDAAAKIIIVSDVEHPNVMVAALSAGARGYVTMNTELDIVLGAIQLVQVGGTFVPASSLLSARSVQQDAPANPSAGVFSPRQRDVLELARQGDPNKIIAYKLNMSEATAKIHIRNMMRKLNARNRTELIFKSKELLEAA